MKIVVLLENFDNFMQHKKPLYTVYKGFLAFPVIPYLEPSGNYNPVKSQKFRATVIPYLEPPGNYNAYWFIDRNWIVIPYQEPSGDYNKSI